MVNRILANAVGYLNALVAIALIVTGSLIFAPDNYLVGAIIGFIGALIVCGLIALFIDMRIELIQIREVLEKLAALPRSIP